MGNGTEGEEVRGGFHRAIFGLSLAIGLVLAMLPCVALAETTTGGVASASSRWYAGDPYTYPALAFDGNLDIYREYDNPA